MRCLPHRGVLPKACSFGGDSSESGRSWDPDQEVRLPVEMLSTFYYKNFLDGIQVDMNAGLNPNLTS